VQQALVTAWRELRRLRDHERFEPWLRKILMRECYLDSRRARRLEATVRVLPSMAADHPDDFLGVALRDELDRAFRRLPSDQRAVLVLHHYLGLTPAEIADSMGIPAGTARSRLHYAHSAMRAALEADARRTGGGRA
jgi:RNA polymerase sigma-70 factor (ECF subfamily)